MRLSNFKSAYWGKEDEELEEKTRRDIIYRIFLGDRQIWEKTEEDNVDAVDLSNKVTTTWYIIQDFNLNKVTAETNISGNVDWGDEDLDDAWRSGISLYHHYTVEGLYNISLICKKQRSDAVIARIEDLTPMNELGRINELVGISFGTVPYAEHRLGEPNKGVFEDILTLTNVTIPRGLTYIPPRLCYNTNVKKIIFPKYLDDKKLEIGSYAFTGGSMEELWISSSVSKIGTQAMGYKVDGSVPDGLKVHCVKNTAGASYASQLFSANNTVIIDDDWDEVTIS